MSMKNIIKLINEEISEYDFLGAGKMQEADSLASNFSTPEFQEQFINDIINKKVKISDAVFLENSEDDIVKYPGDHPTFNIKYTLQIDNYNGLNFELLLEGQNIDYSLKISNEKQTYDTPGSSEISYKYINWNDIDTIIITDQNEKIEIDKNLYNYSKFIHKLLYPVLKID
jgi:hypothetical protein